MAQHASRPCIGSSGNKTPASLRSAFAAEVLTSAECFRSGRLGLDLLDVGRRRTVDRDPTRLHRLRDFADQFDLQQAIVKRRTLDLDIVGQVELTLERPRRDALLEEFVLLLFGLAAFDRQHVLLGGDGDLVGREACQRQGYLVPVLAKPLDVAGRVIVLAAWPRAGPRRPRAATNFQGISIG
jgi:hypothetical protein